MGKQSCGDHLLFSEDVLIQILVWLPVRSLLRFKTVCKSWLKLIESSFFIHLHTTTTFNSSSKFGTFILQTAEPYYYEHDMGHLIKLYMLSSATVYEKKKKKKKKKKMVFKVDDLDFLAFDFRLRKALHIVGSCNGIICLHDHRGGYKKQGHYSNLRDVFLWNPATRQFRILPESIPMEEGKQDYTGHIYEFIAFGFDVKTKDYKVLRINPWDRSEEGGCMCQVQVYSLSTDSWKLLEGINSLPFPVNQGMFGNHGIYLNGSYFFQGIKFIDTDDDDDEICHLMMMLSFDFTKEIFTTVQLPDNNNSENSVLSYLGDKMAVFTTPRIDSDGRYWDIWVLNEQHGSDSVVVYKESWTKLHSFQIKTKGYEPYSEPRCTSNDGEFVLISTEWDKLLLFNLVTKEAITIADHSGCRAAYVYKESLVSIMGGGNVLFRWQLPTHGTC